MKKILISSIALITLCISSAPGTAAEDNSPRLGIWITVFSKEQVLLKKNKMDELVTNCVSAGIDDIYLQIYRADKAYYDSTITDRSKYEMLLGSFGSDPLDHLIKKAGEKGIKVHAWMNLMSIAANNKANIVKKYGKDILTRDQHGRLPLKSTPPDELDKYYIRENQIFLEPGDVKVRDYIASIAEEIIMRYPSLSGIHLDYVRYPAAVPFIPGSRFTSHGISYGYTAANTGAFLSATGINVHSKGLTKKEYAEWDKWRRDNVTALVKDISYRASVSGRDIQISCTTVPSLERTYTVTLQDWTRWLKEELADHIAIMDYTTDPRQMELNASSMMLSGVRNKIHIGLGAYLLEDKAAIKEQIERALSLEPAGIIIFSYDDIAGDKKMLTWLGKNFKGIN